jgi:DNA repair exonuclease SbcCD ATPase subunit
MRVSAALARLIIVAASFAQATTTLAEGESLHSVIDQHMVPVAGFVPLRCSDAEFLRRVSLDLVGMPPTADEARAFLADTSQDKRERLIDRLFSSPHFVRNLAAVLDVMLMERRPYTHVTADEWQAWLLKSVRENKPWNVMAREIIQADGDDPAQRPAARFALDRESEPHLLTRDIGRIFFGRDMQCAQCHDHPLIAGYLQSDYHGLLAFVSPQYALVRKEGDKQTTLQAEKAGADLTFESVFVRVPRRTGPRVPEGVVIDEPFLLPDEEYEVPPADNVKPVPKFSRRAKLAELATNGSNQAFNWNIVNRLWAHMFGRGLVHPPDLHHPDNPSANPQLGRALGEHFVAMNFDIQKFLREIALSGTYQRAFDPPPELLAISEKTAAEIAQLQQRRAELEQAAKASADAYATASATWEEAEATMLPVAGELDTARNQYAEAKKKLDEVVKALTDATTQLQAKKSVADPLQQAVTAAQEVVKKLPDDKELADAAQKFAARAQQLATETAALTKTVDEKNAAVPPMTEAWNNTKPPVEAARTKVTPLATTFKTAEQSMREARSRAEADAEEMVAMDRRLTTARQMAQFADLQRTVVAAREAVTAREAELAAAQKQLTDFAAVIAGIEAQGKAANESIATAASGQTATTTEHAKRTEVAGAVAAAAASLEAARQKLPEDAGLAELAKSLQARAAETRAALDEVQKQLDTLAAQQKSAQEAFVAAQESLASALADRSRREQAVEAARTALAAAQAAIAAKQTELDTVMAELNDRWTRDFTVASLKPLTPEQLCWTVFRVTGVYDRYWQAEVAELDKTKPLTDEQKQDSAQVAARTLELEQRVYDKLKGNIGTFVAYYAAAAGQPQGDFFATADQALFAANGGSINSWVVPAGDNVTDRIIKQSDARIAAEELYLGILTRMPTEAEIGEVATYLSGRAADQPAAAQELVWGLLNSAEFRFNH